MAERFGSFLLLEQLGKGGMGEAWLAQPVDVPGARGLCVVKTMRADVADDAEAVKRFGDEAGIGLLLVHPCIARVVDAGRVRDVHYLALDLVEGIDLRKLLSRVDRIDPAVALWMAGSVLDGLAHAHAARHPLTGAPLCVVHRDVSPHNAMAAADGSVRVIDFGLALSTLKQAQTEHDVVLGKLGYMSPEQARGEKVDARTDVFAVGAMLYEMLAGDRFWGALPSEAVHQLIGRGDHVPAKLARLDDDARALVSSMIAGQRNARMATAHEARDRVAQLLVARGGFERARAMTAALVEEFGAGELRTIRTAKLHAIDPVSPANEPRTESLARLEVAAIEAALAQAPTMTGFAPPMNDASPTLMLVEPPVPPPTSRAPALAPFAVVAVAAALAAFLVAVVVLTSNATPRATDAGAAILVPPSSPSSPASAEAVVDAGDIAAPPSAPDPTLDARTTLRGCHQPCAAVLREALPRTGSIPRAARTTVDDCVRRCDAAR